MHKKYILNDKSYIYGGDFIWYAEYNFKDKRIENYIKEIFGKENFKETDESRARLFNKWDYNSTIYSDNNFYISLFIFSKNFDQGRLSLS